MTLEQRVYTIDDLWQLSQRDKGVGRYELVRGELREMSPTGWLHGQIAGEILGLLRDYLKANPIGRLTAAETGYVLAHDEADTVRAPDVGFIRSERIPETLPESGYVPFAPDLAVEVVSPGNTIAEIDEKVGDYLRGGTLLVWVAFPGTKTIHVHTSEGTHALDIRDSLTGGDVLPRFEVPVSEIFS